MGLRWSVDHLTIPLASIVAAHNMDMLGRGADQEVRGPASVQTSWLSRRLSGVRRRHRQRERHAPRMAIDRTGTVTANPRNRFCPSDRSEIRDQGFAGHLLL